MILEELGFKLDKRATKKTDRHIIYKKVRKYDVKILGIEEETDVLIFNKNSKRVFMKRVVTHCGEKHLDALCADIELLNAIAEFMKNM